MTTSSQPTGRALYARLLGYVRPYWKMFALGLFGMMLVAATEPLFPALMKPLLDKGFSGTGVRDLWIVPLTIMGIFIVRGAASFSSSYAMSWVSQRVLTDLRSLLCARLLQLPTDYFDAHPSGRIINRIVYDVNNVTAAATSAFTTLVRDSMVVLGLLGWLFYLNWKLTMVTLLLGPAVALVVRKFSGRLRRLNHEHMLVSGELTQVVEEAISCQKVIKIYGGQQQEQERFDQKNERLRRFNIKMTVAAAATVPVTQLLTAVAVSVVITIALVQSMNNQTTVGGFVSFITAMLMLLAPLKHLADLSAPLQRGLAAAESIFTLLDAPAELDRGTIELATPDAIANSAAQNSEALRGQIEFRQVGLQYRSLEQTERWALRDINLTIQAGETLALVGASGGGKTSLVHLLPRFYQPTQGTIYLDHLPLPDIKLAALRAQIAFVSQETLLFNDTVANNIAYGLQRTASLDEMRAAAKAAHLLDVIEALPEGFNTVIGEKGSRLSGGQRQRLAIARAVLKNAPILILDEATSALDSESERHVQEALEELMKGRTTLVIAHRLSTIERADRIAVLDAGKIVELGKHAELLALNGIYANLYRIQYAREHDLAQDLAQDSANAVMASQQS